MVTNFVFYKLRKINDWNEEKLGDLYRSVDYVVSPKDLFSWMKQDIYEGYQEMPDQALAALLNAFILEKRGKKDDLPFVHEDKLSNNLILRKIKIALNFKDEDIVNTLARANIRAGKAEINAFFRDTKHAHFRPCLDQFLRNFLTGLQLSKGKSSDTENTVTDL
jgi:uncharacterized protein YehS (DUF1456 family)